MKIKTTDNRKSLSLCTNTSSSYAEDFEYQFVYILSGYLKVSTVNISSKSCIVLEAIFIAHLLSHDSKITHLKYHFL